WASTSSSNVASCREQVASICVISARQLGAKRKSTTTTCPGLAPPDRSELFNRQWSLHSDHLPSASFVKGTSHRRQRRRVLPQSSKSTKGLQLFKSNHSCRRHSSLGDNDTFSLLSSINQCKKLVPGLAGGKITIHSFLFVHSNVHCLRYSHK